LVRHELACGGCLKGFHVVAKVTAFHVIHHVAVHPQPPVKNGDSNPTKVQLGQDQTRKDIMNDCQEKALKEGFHERE